MNQQQEHLANLERQNQQALTDITNAHVAWSNAVTSKLKNIGARDGPAVVLGMDLAAIVIDGFFQALENETGRPINGTARAGILKTMPAQHRDGVIDAALAKHMFKLERKIKDAARELHRQPADYSRVLQGSNLDPSIIPSATKHSSHIGQTLDHGQQVTRHGSSSS